MKTNSQAIHALHPCVENSAVPFRVRIALANGVARSEMRKVWSAGEYLPPM